MFGKVVFDPGHGAKINAGPTGYYEGDTMLKLGMMLKARGYTLTKEDGTDTDLLARVKRAKALGANTLISLHTDWVPPDKPTQTEKTMVIYSLNRPEDKAIAENIAKEIAVAIGVDKSEVWTCHASYSTPEKPIDYYGILRHSVTLGIEHAFIVEHCNHAQMAQDTDKKLLQIVNCYEKMLNPKPIDPNAWKYAGIEELAKAGIISDPDRLKSKIDGTISTWETTIILNNMYKKLKGE